MQFNTDGQFVLSVTGHNIALCSGVSVSKLCFPMTRVRAKGVAFGSCGAGLAML